MGPQAMNTRHPTETTVLYAAGMATVVGFVVGAPWLALAAAGLAATLAMTPGREHSAAIIGGRWQALRLETPVFRSFMDDDRDLGRDIPSGSRDMRGPDRVDEDGDEDEPTYEDLAASLESDEEDISFLPPFASETSPYSLACSPVRKSVSSSTRSRRECSRMRRSWTREPGCKPSNWNPSGANRPDQAAPARTFRRATR